MKCCTTLVAALALGLAGCCTVQHVPLQGTNKEHVTVNNYGWKLFDWIPLFCGNADENGAMGCAFFRDDVTQEKLEGRLVKFAAGRSIECPVFDMQDTVIYSIFGLPIPYVITYKELTLSGIVQ